MKPSSAITLVALAVMVGTVDLFTGVAAGQSSKVGTMKGRVCATGSSGEVLPPESATVYILFSAEMTRDSFGRELSFTHKSDIDTAGGQYSYQLNNLLDKNKDLKRLEKSVRHNPRPEDANQIATFYLRSVDEALTHVRNWLARHLDRGWQMRTIVPDPQGFWSAGGLPPGEYKVVVRGTFRYYDADWEGGADLLPGGNASFPMTRPRFFCRKQQ